MQFPRSVRKMHGAALALCVGLFCPAQIRADDSSMRHPEAGPDQSVILSDAEVAEISDYVLGGIARELGGMVLTMAASPWGYKPEELPPAPNLDSFTSSVPMPPTPPNDQPGPGGGNPTPSGQAPEPGTLVAGLTGAGALLYRYYRRRRTRQQDREVEMNEEATGDLIAA